MSGHRQMQQAPQIFRSRYGYMEVVKKVEESKTPYMMGATLQHKTLCSSP